MTTGAIYTKKLGQSVAKRAKPVLPKNFHVIPLGLNKWAVVLDGASSSVKSFTEKNEALIFAKKSAKSKNGEVVIHNTSGKVIKRITLDKN
ncbi:MAG: DUF2188 domain-containing protein [Saprospiraceae bacterium]